MEKRLDLAVKESFFDDVFFSDWWKEFEDQNEITKTNNCKSILFCNYIFFNIIYHILSKVYAQ